MAEAWCADAMWILPSAHNVDVKKFKQAWVNGGSNYDSLNRRHYDILLSLYPTVIVDNSYLSHRES